MLLLPALVAALPGWRVTLPAWRVAEPVALDVGWDLAGHHVAHPLADVHGVSPEVFGPPGVAAPTRELWIALRAALRSVLEKVTIADLAGGTLPAAVAALLEDPDAWIRRPDPMRG